MTSLIIPVHRGCDCKRSVPSTFQTLEETKDLLVQYAQKIRDIDGREAMKSLRSNQRLK